MAGCQTCRSPWMGQGCLQAGGGVLFTCAIYHCGKMGKQIRVKCLPSRRATHSAINAGWQQKAGQLNTLAVQSQQAFLLMAFSIALQGSLPSNITLLPSHTVLSCHHTCALLPSHCAPVPSHLCSRAITLVLSCRHTVLSCHHIYALLPSHSCSSSPINTCFRAPTFHPR